MWLEEKSLSTNLFGMSYRERKYCIVFPEESHFLCANMPARCVLYGCSNKPNAAHQIALHPIPFYRDSRTEAVKRRQSWVGFVKQRLANWEPTKESCVCSRHFKDDDFMHIINILGLSERTFP